MILTIDIGNSRLKWATFDLTGTIIAYGSMLNAEIEMASIPKDWGACQQAVMSNVANERYDEGVGAKLASLNIPLQKILSSASALGVRNAYDQPEKLGTDRWASLIAAKQHYGAPCIVVNAGTAFTVDALGRDDVSGSSVFLGGLILPGLGLMQSSLMQATHGITHTSGAMQDFPVNTENAIYTGILSGMVGAVHFMLAKLSQQENLPVRCILTGGDALRLSAALQALGIQMDAVVIDEMLVLQGLFLIGREA